MFEYFVEVCCHNLTVLSPFLQISSILVDDSRVKWTTIRVILNCHYITSLFQRLKNCVTLYWCIVLFWLVLKDWLWTFCSWNYNRWCLHRAGEWGFFCRMTSGFPGKALTIFWNLKLHLGLSHSVAGSEFYRSRSPLGVIDRSQKTCALCVLY